MSSSVPQDPLPSASPSPIPSLVQCCHTAITVYSIYPPHDD